VIWRHPGGLFQPCGGSADWIILASILSSTCGICSKRERHMDWIVMIRCDWLVLRWTTALETKWYHLTPSSPSEIPQPHPNTATWYGSEMLTLDNIGTVWHYALQWCKATMIMRMTHSLTDLMAMAWWCIGEAVGLMLHSSQVPLSSKCSLCSYVLVFLCINDVL